MALLEAYDLPAIILLTQFSTASPTHLLQAPVLFLRPCGKMNGGVTSPSSIVTLNEIYDNWMSDIDHSRYMVSDCTVLRLTPQYSEIFILDLPLRMPSSAAYRLQISGRVNSKCSTDPTMLCGQEKKIINVHAENKKIINVHAGN